MTSLSLKDELMLVASNEYFKIAYLLWVISV